jgi:hypothetical protein
MAGHRVAADARAESAPHIERLADYFRTTMGRQIALDAVKSWTEQVQKAWEASRENTSNLVAGQPLPAPVEVVDATFDSLEKLLKMQRGYYHAIADAYTPVVEQAVANAQSAVESLTPKS